VWWLTWNVEAILSLREGVRNGCLIDGCQLITIGITNNVDLLVATRTGEHTFLLSEQVHLLSRDIGTHWEMNACPAKGIRDLIPVWSWEFLQLCLSLYLLNVQFLHAVTRDTKGKGVLSLIGREVCSLLIRYWWWHLSMLYAQVIVRVNLLSGEG
jgi:hypothetical protein